MKRSLAVLLVGVALSGLTYGVLVAPRKMAIRDLELSCGPELAWIKTEFELDQATFERVRVLHEAYLPVCEDYCRQIDAQHRKLAELLATSETVTPEISRVLSEASELRARCQGEMLKHFFAVSHAMPPEQGRRYLMWMQEATMAPSHLSMVPDVAGSSNDDQHIH